MSDCTACALDGTDACMRGPGRAIDDSVCGDYIAKRPMHKGRECIYCKKRYECPGKENTKPCLMIEEET